MAPLRAAFLQFRHVTHALAELSEHQQVMALKFALFRAFERAHDFESRGRTAEVELAELKAKTAARDELHDAFNRHLHAELVQATQALAHAQAEYEKELRTVSRELLSSSHRCETLDELCRSLLLTLEQAADEHAAETAIAAAVEPVGRARVSA